MATHSSILAWKIPWMEEPDRLQSMGSQRVGHDWETSLSFTNYKGKNIPSVKVITEVWANFYFFHTCLYHKIAQRVKNLPAMRDSRAWSLGLGRSPGERHGNPLQHSCLENPIDGGAWQATVHGVAKSWTRLSNFTCRPSEEVQARTMDYLTLNWPHTTHNSAREIPRYILLLSLCS